MCASPASSSVSTAPGSPIRLPAERNVPESSATSSPPVRSQVGEQVTQRRFLLHSYGPAQHRGRPDEPGNLLCLCPNHHVLFDRGVIAVQDDPTVTDMTSGAPTGPLRLAPNHEIQPEHLAQHRKVISKRSWAAPSNGRIRTGSSPAPRPERRCGR
ncbi:HNH endonuclease [Streptosporangium lutulentum]|uniref:HNH endonuclease n=1 Tax=Streptosporangium lutulentum TaxID=1461250 RepID=UPI0035213AA3